MWAFCTIWMFSIFLLIYPQYDEYNLPLPEEDYKPKGSSWLYHSDAIRTYLSLMEKSRKDATLEACAGALQNLTASRGMVTILLFADMFGWILGKIKQENKTVGKMKL